MEEDDAFELVMPFVACASQGGPFDDGAFVAGMTFGRIDAHLEQCGRIGVHEMTLSLGVDRRLLPQLDLAAMRHSYKMTTVDPEESADDYAFVTFTRP